MTKVGAECQPQFSPPLPRGKRRFLDRVYHCLPCIMPDRVKSRGIFTRLQIPPVLLFLPHLSEGAFLGGLHLELFFVLCCRTSTFLSALPFSLLIQRRTGTRRAHERSQSDGCAERAAERTGSACGEEERQQRQKQRQWHPAERERRQEERAQGRCVRAGDAQDRSEHAGALIPPDPSNCWALTLTPSQCICSGLDEAPSGWENPL